MIARTCLPTSAPTTYKMKRQFHSYQNLLISLHVLSELGSKIIVSTCKSLAGSEVFEYLLDLFKASFPKL